MATPISQAELAYYFLNGIILKKDLKEGIRLIEMSVEQDNAMALFTKGNLFEKGVGVQKNLAEASRWYQLSAEKNNPNALVALGKFYEAGVVFKADRAEALKFYRRAAAIGNVEGKALADRLSKPDASTVLDYRPPQ